MKRLSLLLSVSLVACAVGPTEPTLQLPDRFTWDMPPTIRVAGLEPTQTYILELERRGEYNANFTELNSIAYTADETGRIDTSSQAAQDDDELSPYIPIRTMSYSDETLEDLDPGFLRITVRGPDDQIVDEEVIGIGPDLSLIEEEPFHPDFTGAFILKAKNVTEPRPALVMLGGSEGGDRGSRYGAPQMVEEGFVVLGLPYYSPAWFGSEAQFPELPRAFAEIPVEYLERAVAELRKRPDVDPDRILLRGGSKGAEFVLLAGSLIPDDSPGGGFCAIVADVPTDVVWEGWGPGTSNGENSSFSWQGEPLPFVPYKDMGRVFQPDSNYTMIEAHENGRQENPEMAEAARIQVERIDEPVLVIGGDKDTTWASGPMARRIKATRDAAGLETESYTYAEAGHSVGDTPLRRGSEADTVARQENYAAMIDFLNRHAQRSDCRSVPS